MAIADPEPRAVTARSLPRPLRAGLARVGRRLRSVRAIRGLGTLLLVAAGVAAVAMAADFLRPLPTRARWIAWGAWIGAGVVVCLTGIAWPLIRRQRRQELAAVAERPYPSLARRLSTAVVLAEEAGRAHGSPSLIAAEVEGSAGRVAAVDPRLAVPARRSRRRLAAGAVALLMVTLPAAIWPDPFGILWRRFLMPWTDPGTAGLVTLRVEPGDAVVPPGGSVNVTATAASRLGGTLPEEATLEWVGPVGNVRRMPMEPADAEGGGFVATLPPIEGPVNYRVVAGRWRSRAVPGEARPAAGDRGAGGGGRAAAVHEEAGRGPARPGGGPGLAGEPDRGDDRRRPAGPRGPADLAGRARRAGRAAAGGDGRARSVGRPDLVVGRGGGAVLGAVRPDD